ncbi:hypothetical protein ON010_g10798 [Phytophthora cinnamomi]|nr:hypothetical protein ON010_g10798 [Phytophthora cinnamomi]
MEVGAPFNEARERTRRLHTSASAQLRQPFESDVLKLPLASENRLGTYRCGEVAPLLQDQRELLRLARRVRKASCHPASQQASQAPSSLPPRELVEMVLDLPDATFVVPKLEAQRTGEAHGRQRELLALQLDATELGAQRLVVTAVGLLGLDVLLLVSGAVVRAVAVGVAALRPEEGLHRRRAVEVDAARQRVHALLRGRQRATAPVKRSRDEASKLLGEKMLQGWTMLGASCPVEDCYTPLMRSKHGKVGVQRSMFCVRCDQYVVTEEEAKKQAEHEAEEMAAAAAAEEAEAEARYEEERRRRIEQQFRLDEQAKQAREMQELEQAKAQRAAVTHAHGMLVPIYTMESQSGPDGCSSFLLVIVAKRKNDNAVSPSSAESDAEINAIRRQTLAALYQVEHPNFL